MSRGSWAGCEGQPGPGGEARGRRAEVAAVANLLTICCDGLIFLQPADTPSQTLCACARACSLAACRAPTCRPPPAPRHRLS